MASKYSIETVFKLIDQITTPLDKINIKGKSVGNALKRDFMSAEKSVDNFGKTVSKIAKGAALAGIGALGVGIGIATKQFIDYDNAITAATAKFKDLDVTSETYAESLKKVGKVSRDVAAATEYNAVDTAGALDKMAMAGLTSEQSMRLLMGTTNLATAAGMDLTTAVDIATDSLGAFGLIADDASQLEVNLNRVSDVMAKTTNMFNTDMPGMFEAVKKGAPAFTSAGQSIESFSALIGVMASSGVKGSEAGTQLRNMMLSIANPSDKAAEALKRLGVTVKDSGGNYLDVIDILQQFEQGTKNMGSAEKAAALATIFGSRSVTGLNILLQEGTDKLREYRTTLENAGGSAANIADAMRGSIKNKIEVLGSALTEVGFKFVEAFQVKGIGLIERLTDAISEFDPQPIIDALVTTANVIGTLMKIVWNLRDFILVAAAAWHIYKAAMMAAVIASKIMGVVKAVQTLMAVQKSMNVVQATFNVLLTANPIGLIIAAIAILIGLIILAVRHWDTITAAISYAGQWIQYVALLIWDNLCGAFESLTGFISENSEKVLFFISIFTGPFGVIFSIINELRENWASIVETFKTDGIIAGLKRLGGVLISALLAPIQGFLEMLSKIPVIGEKIAPAAGKIEEFRNTLKGIDGKNDLPEEPKARTVRPARVRPELPAALRSKKDDTTPESGPTAPLPSASPQSQTKTSFTQSPLMPASMDTTSSAAGQASKKSAPPPVFLSLQKPETETVTQQAQPPIQSPWRIPVTYTGGTMPDVTESVTIPANIERGERTIESASQINGAGATPPGRGSAQAATVPVKYDFPELIVPPELIHPAIVTVQWALSPALTGNQSPRGIPGGIIPREIANSNSARVDRLVPPAARGTINESTREALVPPAPPMTRAEQTAAEQVIYSKSENQERIVVELALEKGLKAKTIAQPKSPNVMLEVSGGA
jgi:TP901 family phage tail tape measure protein